VIGYHGNVHFVNDAEEWQIEGNKAKATGKVIVAKFFATWCSPCKSMASIFVELSKKIGHQLVFLKINIEAVSDVAATNEVRSMPTFLFIRDGHQIDKIVGANKQELVMKCNQYATSG
jgi:thioredoxin 1